METYILKKGGLLICCLFTLLLSMSCSKWDEFKGFIEDGEIVYVGKLDSAKILSGDGRIKVRALLKPDPKISKVQIFWNDKKDSVLFDVNIEDRLFERILPMNEGVVSLMLYTYDSNGNKSIMVPVVGRAYGERYKAGLSNRLISNAVVEDGVGIIDWLSMDLSNGPIATEVKYLSNSGVEKVIKVPIKEDKTTIRDLHASAKTFSYRTLFLPQENSIDTFYTDYVQAGLAKDVTGEYLKNTKMPIATISRSTRWAIPQDWIVNSAVLNYKDGAGAYFGGVDYEFGGPFLAMEAGWSTDNMVSIVNGKIYQHATLPAGDYKFEMDIPGCTANGDFFTVVAAGAELPNVENMSRSIGFLKTNTEGTHVLSFVLSETTVVTLGFVGNLPNKGGGDGTFWRITGVRLKQTVSVF